MAQIASFYCKSHAECMEFCMPHTYAKYQTTCAKCGGLMTNM